MDKTIETLVGYFKQEVPALKSSYQWKIPDIEDFPLSGHRSYDANVALKKFLHEKWIGASLSQKLNLAQVIISDWGGVKSNKKSTIIEHVTMASQKAPATPIKGVASYSKILSIAEPSRYAIYDARVAACLNAIQWNSGLLGVAFNYIPGRNNITGNSLKKAGFSCCKSFSVKQLKALGWKSIKRDETYSVYLKLLTECLASLGQGTLSNLEMVLFANAEKECAQALQSVAATSA